MAPNLSTLRPLIAGDVIIDTKPVIHIVYNGLKGDYCDNCLNNSQQLKKCSNCHKMSYCDKNCQRIDWEYHKNECKILMNKKFKPNEIKWSERLLIRLWLTIKFNKNFLRKKLQLFDGSDISIEDIKVNIEELSKDSDRITDFERICTHFEEYGISFVREELLHWFGVITTSVIRQEFMSYSSYKGGPIDHYQIPVVGIGLYPQLYAVNHSCLPNSVIIFNGLSMQLRAIDKIGVNTQINTSYVYLSQNKSERHKYLKLKYLIRGCSCLKCERNLDSNIDYRKLESLFDKQTLQMSDSFLNLSQLTTEMEEISDISRKALGEFNPKLTEILIIELIYRQFNGLCVAGGVGHQYYRRLKEHIRITYGVNHPIYTQNHTPNPFLQLNRI